VVEDFRGNLLLLDLPLNVSDSSDLKQEKNPKGFFDLSNPEGVRKRENFITFLKPLDAV